MGRSRKNTWTGAVGTALAVFILAQPGVALATQASSLSRWLSEQAVPELRERLGRHPRYENQRVAVVSAGDDALSAAIVTVLLRSFPGQYGVRLHAWQDTAGVSATIRQPAPSSIDELRCAAPASFDYLLQVSAMRPASGRDEVRLTLVPAVEPSEPAEAWYWRGRFSPAERTYLERATESPLRDGSLAAPWRPADSAAAGRALVREFACGLRPQLQHNLTLDWRETSALPGAVSDTVNIARHLLGSLRELGFSATEPAYAVDFRLVPMRGNVWQLWIDGAPRRVGLAPVQAVAYFSLDIEESLLPSLASGHSPAMPAEPVGDPLDFLDVQLLDATQTDGRGARAALQVTLQIVNRARWPLEYAFTLSGGHFDNCIATPAAYRHDSYGSVEGSIAAGEAVVRRLVVDNAQHRPTPLLGVRKCAGFRDLDGFEEFSRQGYKVTDYVRWKM